MPSANARAYLDTTKVSVKPSKRLRSDNEPAKKVSLLWGDEVFVVSIDGSTATVAARDHLLELPVDSLRDTPILSWYQIDCGQGDAAMLHMPDGRWLMVDAGPAKAKSNSGAGVRDFVAWKTLVDQSWKNEFDVADKRFRMTAVATHPDNDHFAGFADLENFLDRGVVGFEDVFHCGVGRFDGDRVAVSGGSGHSQLGAIVGSANPDLFVADLIDDFDDVESFSTPAPGRDYVLSGEYARWLQRLRSQRQAGADVGPLRRVDSSMRHLPGFEPTGDLADASIRLLGPVLESSSVGPRMRFLDGASKSAMKQPSRTRNGHSVVMRVDYGNVRLMLTGDLNFRSQVVLMNEHDDDELACHVAKACHHGSDDISSTFLTKMGALATLFSSGDNETHVHPRAKALALAAAATPPRPTGRKNRFLGFAEDDVEAPLIYSTELSRSVQLWKGGGVVDRHGIEVNGARVRNTPRSRRGKQIEKLSRDWMLADDLVYGMINVRTDGERIVIAVMNEGSSSFHVQELRP